MSASFQIFLRNGISDNRYVLKENNKTYIPVFLEVKDSSSFHKLEQSQVHFRTIIHEIATADIPVSNLQEIINSNEILRIELPQMLQKTDTLVNKFTNAEKVLKGFQPLGQSYDGTGVVVGVIDDGIDFLHKEFLDSTGKTKVKAFWNMETYGIPPKGFGYGSLWLPDSINAYIKNNKYPEREAYVRTFGGSMHGTSVTGLAAGNSGVAPGATLVVVSFLGTVDNLLRSDKIIDGISFIYQWANLLNKKCVINLSYGVNDGGPHDGNTLVERAIDNFCEEKSDLLVCISAGNFGNNWKHWGGFPIRKDSSYSYFTCLSTASLYFCIPVAYSDSISLSLAESPWNMQNNPNYTKDSIFFQTPFRSISNIINSKDPIADTSYYKNKQIATIYNYAASHYNKDYDELILSIDERPYTGMLTGEIQYNESRYKYILKGSGNLHVWFTFLNLHPLYFFGNGPTNDSSYVATDNNYSTLIPSNAHTVISSGAYNIRNCYQNVRHEFVSQYPSCQLAYFSSHGPTLDGRIKPDLLNPGDNVITPRSRTLNYYWYQTDIDSNWQYFGGTSASSPITAGMAALLWQHFPEFTRDSIINRLKSGCYTDSYLGTGLSLPNNLTGWGKADVFRSMTGVISNFSSFCLQDSICFNQAPPPSPNPQPLNGFQMDIYPNPVRSVMKVHYSSQDHVEFRIYNLMGQLVYKVQLPESYSQMDYYIDTSQFPSSLYIIQAANTFGNLTKKIVISH